MDLKLHNVNLEQGLKNGTTEIHHPQIVERMPVQVFTRSHLDGNWRQQIREEKKEMIRNLLKQDARVLLRNVASHVGVYPTTAGNFMKIELNITRKSYKFFKKQQKQIKFTGFDFANIANVNNEMIQVSLQMCYFLMSANFAYLDL